MVSLDFAAGGLGKFPLFQGHHQTWSQPHVPHQLPADLFGYLFQVQLPGDEENGQTYRAVSFFGKTRQKRCSVFSRRNNLWTMMEARCCDVDSSNLRSFRSKPSLRHLKFSTRLRPTTRASPSVPESGS